MNGWVECYVSTGGFIERVLSVSSGSESVIEKYLKACKDFGYVPPLQRPLTDG
jgi:hypothetical protein